MINGFHHVAICTPSLERFVAHYRDWFGFERVSDASWPLGNERINRVFGLEQSSGRFAMLRLKSFYIEVFEFSHPEGRRPDHRVCDPGLTHICLCVSDIWAEYERLKGLGMTFHAPPGGSEKNLTTYGRDCDGNILELLDPELPYRFLDKALA